MTQRRLITTGTIPLSTGKLSATQFRPVKSNASRRTYWYYYYTIYYSPSTYTTREMTTTTLTTTFSIQAANEDDASLSFDLSSLNLPTPTSAESYLPPTPTPGAVIFVACAGTTTSATHSDGSTAC